MAELPSIKTVQEKNGVQTVEFQAPAQKDVDEFFDKTVAKALQKEQEDESVDRPSEDDQNKVCHVPRLITKAHVDRPSVPDSSPFGC